MVSRTSGDGNGQTSGRPGLVDDSLHAPAVAEDLPGDVDGGLHEVREVRLGFQAVHQRGVPDPPQHLHVFPPIVVAAR